MNSVVHKTTFIDASRLLSVSDFRWSICGTPHRVNHAHRDVATCTPGTWATIARQWNSGDKVEIRIPLPFRWVPVDPQHPKRAAVARGPVVLVQDGRVHEPIFRLPQAEADLNKQLVPDNVPGVYRFVPRMAPT